MEFNVPIRTPPRAAINPQRRIFMAPAMMLAAVFAFPGAMIAFAGLGMVFIGSEILAWLEGGRK